MLRDPRRPSRRLAALVLAAALAPLAACGIKGPLKRVDAPAAAPAPVPPTTAPDPTLPVR
jgi:predicted small lipoprotein YifL